jgi:hypothetical protein
VKLELPLAELIVPLLVAVGLAVFIVAYIILLRWVVRKRRERIDHILHRMDGIEQQLKRIAEALESHSKNI